MKLTSITPHHPIAIGSFRTGTGTIDLTDPKWKDWQVHARGPALFIMSPPGWAPGQPPTGNERKVFEVPRSSVYITWQFAADDKLEDVGKWSPPAAAPREEPRGTYADPAATAGGRGAIKPVRPDPSRTPVVVEDADPTTGATTPAAVDQVTSPNGVKGGRR